MLCKPEAVGNEMIRSRLSVFLCFIGLTMMPWAASEGSEPLDGVPGRDTPGELTEAWLRFHEAGLCQGVDAVFTFTKDGMSVRGLIEDERSAQKFGEMLTPLRRSYKIELTLAKPPLELKPEDREEAGDDRSDPPASLWENYELRSFFGDPVARAREGEGFEEGAQFNLPPSALLKQRLLIYAEQTLALSRKMERFAKDLPVLTRAALDPGMAPALRLQAKTVCLAHLQYLERAIGKLNGNLEAAFPRPPKKERPAQPGGPALSLKTPVDYADYISGLARDAAQRVYRFIHPEPDHYSVSLDELRRPGLLDSFKTLQKADQGYQTAMAKAR